MGTLSWDSFLIILVFGFFTGKLFFIWYALHTHTFSHIQWHVQAGLAATFIEAPLEIQKRQFASPDMLDQCRKQNIKTQGNAAGFPDVETFTGFGTPLQIVGS